MLNLFATSDVQLACRNPDCPNPRFPAEEALFLCPSRNCRGAAITYPGQPERFNGRTLFKPRRFDYSVKCLHCPHVCYEKICPYCFSKLPPFAGNSSAVAVIGASVSGKTTFVTALLRQIRLELSKRSSLEMSLEWDDQSGLDYFKFQERSIFGDCTLPEGTQKESALQSMQVTVRFPIRGFWRQLRHGKAGMLSLYFPDPSGEFFQSQDDLHRLDYLGAARAIVLMVDPFMSERQRERLRAEGRELPPYEAGASAEALGSLIKVLRGIHNKPEGLLDQQLAVLVTKCDVPGVFDPDDPKWGGAYPPQTRDYDPQRAARLSAAIENFIEDDLGLPEVVSMARRNFSNLGFFAASALGGAPIREERDGGVVVRLDRPRPRRVEEPLLWILHQWGYI